MQAFVAFGGLIVALVAFYLSMRPWRLSSRLALWAVGAAGLTAVGARALTAGDKDYLALARLLAREPSAVFEAFRANALAIDATLRPVFDFVFVAGCVLGLAALVAFTPGDKLERTLRPVKIAVISGAIGGALALAIAGIGFGNVVKRHVYIGAVTADDVIDGDTIRMGDVTLRLWGVDAPETHQKCRVNGAAYDCGAAAKQALATLVVGATLVCRKPPGGEPTSRPRETFGRPLLVCTAYPNDAPPTDVAGALVTSGHADLHVDSRGCIDGTYAAERREAIAAGAGVWAGDFLCPRQWRTEPSIRDAFLQGGSGGSCVALVACERRDRSRDAR